MFVLDDALDDLTAGGVGKGRDILAKLIARFAVLAEGISGDG